MVKQIKERKIKDISKVKHVFKYPEVVEKTQVEKPEPTWATKNKVKLDLKTLKLRDFSSTGAGIYTFVVPPYAGHTSMIVDFHNKQSLVETLMENGIERVCAADWKSATEEMKDYNIDNYLKELDVSIDELGGASILSGCARAGGGLMKGDYMLEGFKSLQPEKKLSLGDIKCLVYLLGGSKDDITPKEQVFNAEKHLGTKKSEIVKDTADGGHIGLFMGSKPLREDWPGIAKWIKAHPGR